MFEENALPKPNSGFKLNWSVGYKLMNNDGLDDIASGYDTGKLMEVR